MDTVQRNHQLYSWRDDLFSLAIEFRVGHRDSCWIDTVDDRDDEADVRVYGEKAKQIGRPVVWEVQYETKQANAQA